MKDDSLDRQASDLLPAGFDPLDSLRILTDYLRNLEVAYNELIKNSVLHQRQIEANLRVASKTCEDLEQEKERLTRDLIHLSNQVEELESLLVTANQKIMNYDKQSKKLYRDNEELENKFLKKENDCNFYQTENDRLTKDYESMSSNLASINNRVDDLERKLVAERNSTLTQEKEARRLSSLLSESLSKNKLLEDKLAEAASHFQEEVKKLNDKLGAEAKHELSLVRKRVKMAIGPELDELDKLSKEKLSAELASNLRALISRFISKLQQVGLF
jgi:chromosome segregation ATPase